jgi:ParB-like chromosome segregation protein Spo0J
MCGNIREFGFKIRCLPQRWRVVDAHLRLKAARKLGVAEVPVLLCDEWTSAQVKAVQAISGFAAICGDPTRGTAVR